MTMASLNTLPEESAVVDTNIIIDLYELGRLDLLFNTFDVVSIPKLIYDQELASLVNELASDNTSCYIRKSVVKDFLENLKEQ